MKGKVSNGSNKGPWSRKQQAPEKVQMEGIGRASRLGGTIEASREFEDDVSWDL